MIVLNFAHPLTSDHLAELEGLAGQASGRVVTVDSQIDSGRPLAPPVAAMADACGLSPLEWQTLSLLVVPPALNFSAVALLAELHGRCGYFPAQVRLRPVQGSMPPRYEVAEILDRQAIRDAARGRRRNG